MFLFYTLKLWILGDELLIPQDVRNRETRSTSQIISNSKLSNTKPSPNTPQHTEKNDFSICNTKDYNSLTPKQTLSLGVQLPEPKVVFITDLEDENKPDRVDDSPKRKSSESSESSCVSSEERKSTSEEVSTEQKKKKRWGARLDHLFAKGIGKLNTVKNRLIGIYFNGLNSIAGGELYR